MNAPPDAQVQIAGDFNDWKPEPLNYRDHSGKQGWQKLISLKAGSYQYKYLINGRWVTDPENDQTVGNDLGEYNSVVNV